ncbi:MAG: S-layer homology domain-containing protein [Acidobacteria bacterium]|jgi:hypothetical protein|nr:S-layer homology domain-containing protein [Acidobacteriota bacterium]
MRWFSTALVVLVAVAMSAATLAQAQEAEWNGTSVDASQAPGDAPTSTVAASGYLLEGPPPADPKWGTQDYITRTLGPADFIRLWSCASNGTPDYNGLHYIMPASGQTAICVGAPIHLPAGAHLEYVRLFYYDDIVGSVPSLSMYSVSFFTKTTVADLTPTPSSSGDRQLDFGPLDYTVPVQNTSHSILATLHRSGTTYQGIYGMTFWMHLQVSPAPATATFDDVPVGSFGFQQIEALAASGITAGCNATHFCPDAPVSRAQMAVFLAKALGLHWNM